MQIDHANPNYKELFEWVAEHLYCFRPAFDTAYVSWIDNEGVSWETVIVFDERDRTHVELLMESIEAIESGELKNKKRIE